MTTSIIQTQGLTFYYGSKAALKDLSLEIDQGEMVGLLGPNGAGKTTTIRILNGLLPASAGSAVVLGLNPTHQGSEIRQRSGVLTETPSLYERLTVAQNLDFFGRMNGLGGAPLNQRISQMLELLGLVDRAKDKAGSLSKGLKQRLAIARALLHEPALLFLDEPTSGLDPEASLQVHQVILDLQKQSGCTILLCTHNLIEAQRLCQRFFILNRGQLLGSGSLAELRQTFAPERWLQVTLLNPLSAEQRETFSKNNEVNSLKPITEQVLRVAFQDEAEVPRLLQRMLESGLPVVESRLVQADLDEIYFKLQHEHDTKDGGQ